MDNRASKVLAAAERLASNGAWLQEQNVYERARLEKILRSPNATAEEKAIAQDQLTHYLEEVLR